MTREEDIWQCSQCGTFQGRHDMWTEGDICGDCDSKIITSAEQIKVNEFISTKCQEMKQARNLININGGFCTIEVFDVSPESILLDCSVGISDGYSRNITKIEIELDRNTFDVEYEHEYERITQENGEDEIITKISN